MSTLIEDIRADSTYTQFKKILAVTKGKLKIEESTAEAFALHESRLVRVMTGEDRYSAKKLIDAAYKDLACRSRLVKIRVTNDKHLSYLVDATKSMTKYLRTEYADDLKEFGAAGERHDYVDRILKSAHSTIHEAQQLIDMLDMFIKDIDQASYSLKNVMESLKLLADKKGSTLV